MQRADGKVDDGASLLMRAARALEKGEHWRTQAASWEMLGNVLGAHIASGASKEERDERYAVRSDRESVEGFYVISEDEWSTPGGQDYGEDVSAIRRHHQGQAYQWAAECALAHRQFSDAARLFRKAAVAWQASQRREKEKRAADCYWQAALCAAQSSRFSTRRMIHDKKWCPSCLRDKASEDVCKFCVGSEIALARDGEGKGSDLDRLRACWEQTTSSSEASEEDFKNACRQFAGIQRQLAITGARDEAIAAYRFRLRYMRSFFRRNHPVKYAESALSWLVSHNYSSVGRFIVSLVVLYGLAIPAIWWATGSAVPQGSGQGGVLEAVVFSLANTADFTPGHFLAGDAITTAFQALQALSGYFALGIALWISQRSYDS